MRAPTAPIGKPKMSVVSIDIDTANQIPATITPPKSAKRSDFCSPERPDCYSKFDLLEAAGRRLEAAEWSVPRFPLAVF